jgi:2-methylcitrate dehydratase PrpD
MKRTEQVLSFIRTTQWDRLPDNVRHQSKRCLLDGLGALIAGMKTPVGELMTRIADKQLGGDAATILVSGKRTSAAGAALANGFAANALDIDDGYRRIKGHPGACVLPVVLTAGEMAPRCRGTDLLSGLVTGYEVGIRAGLIRHALYETYHSSGSWGAVAGAAAAGKVLNLDPDSLVQALGAAEYHAPIAPMMKGIDTPCMGKDSIGWGAMVAVLSVLMAEEGFTGILPLFDDTPEPSWIDGLGTEYEMMNLYFKPYAACRWGQPAIAGALHLIKEHDILLDEIERVTVRTFAAATRLTHDPPRTTEQAQYHLAFPVAAALIDGEVGPRQVLPPRIHDPQILDLAGKVDTAIDEAFEKLFPAKACAEVVVHTRSGSSYTSGAVEAIWEPPDHLPSDSDLEKKFRWLVAPVLGEDRANRLVNAVWAFESIDSLKEFITLCIAPAE